jgi:iron complex transport system substrate-binding protein
VSRFTLSEIVGLSVLFVLLLAARASTAEPLRVATLLPFAEEALSLAPERAVVVASVRRELHRPLDQEMIDLGNPHAPSFERLAEARPDLVVGDASVHAALAPRLRALGAELRLVDTSGVEETLGALDGLVREIGGSEKLEARLARLRRELDGLAIAEPVRILALFGAPGSFYAMTERAWLGDLVARLGFVNVAPAMGDGRFPGLVPVSDEILSAVEPDLVVLVAHGDPRAIVADVERRTVAGGAWSSLGRARLGLHALDPRLFSANPGLELDRAARGLVALVESRTARGGTAPAEVEVP